MGHLTEAETDNCTYDSTGHTVPITDEWFSYDADGRLTDVWELTPNSGGYYHTTAQYWANGALETLGGVPNQNSWSFGLDSEGRPYSATLGTSG